MTRKHSHLWTWRWTRQIIFTTAKCIDSVLCKAN